MHAHELTERPNIPVITFIMYGVELWIFLRPTSNMYYTPVPTLPAPFPLYRGSALALAINTRLILGVILAALFKADGQGICTQHTAAGRHPSLPVSPTMCMAYCRW